MRLIIYRHIRALFASTHTINVLSSDIIITQVMGFTLMIIMRMCTHHTTGHLRKSKFHVSTCSIALFIGFLLYIWYDLEM